MGSLIAATKASAQGEASALKKGTDEIVKKIENLWKKKGDLWNKTKDKMNKAQKECNEKLATMQKNLEKRYQGKKASAKEAKDLVEHVKEAHTRRKALMKKCRENLKKIAKDFQKEDTKIHKQNEKTINSIAKKSVDKAVKE